jgi:transcription elongation factor GreA
MNNLFVQEDSLSEDSAVIVGFGSDGDDDDGQSVKSEEYVDEEDEKAEMDLREQYEVDYDEVNEDGKKVTLITKEGLDKLKDELKELKETRRREVAARIKEAISYGDLSENSEYEEAKNEQAFVEGRILELEEKIKNAKIISGRKKVTKTVQLGTTVHLRNLTKGKNDLEVYTIVGSTEADPFAGNISNESPIGNAVLDKEKGDKVKVSVPAGSVEYQIVKLD